jgi:hypothetical protein
MVIVLGRKKKKKNLKIRGIFRKKKNLKEKGWNF